MSAWKTRLPSSSREDELVDVACAAREIADPHEELD